jgi:hypothetical protein
MLTFISASGTSGLSLLASLPLSHDVTFNWQIFFGLFEKAKKLIVFFLDNMQSILLDFDEK